MKAGRDALQSLQSLQSLQVYKALADWIAGERRSPDAAVPPPSLPPSISSPLSLFLPLSLFSLVLPPDVAHFFIFFFFSTPSPSRRSARGPFGVRHLCSVIQSATVLFIPDLFGALESPSLICEKILYFFFLLLFFPIHRLPFFYANAGALIFYFGGGSVESLFGFILFCCFF